MIFNILSYNIFKFGVDKIEYSFSGNRNEKVNVVTKETYGKSPTSINAQTEIDKKIGNLSNEIKGMTKEQIVEYISKKVIEKNKSSNVSAANTLSSTSSVTKICIDPGHGGTDPGTHGQYNGGTYYEDDVNLSIALKLRNYLQNDGYTVYMTRTTDTSVSLTSRYTLANNNSVSCFVSVHLNGVDSTSVHGTTCIYPANHDITHSKGMADWIHSFVTNWDFSSYRTPYKDERGLAVLNGTTMPATITETGFMTNPGDMGYLSNSSNQDSIAGDIYLGIASWDLYGDY